MWQKSAEPSPGATWSAACSGASVQLCPWPGLRASPVHTGRALWSRLPSPPGWRPERRVALSGRNLMAPQDLRQLGFKEDAEQSGGPPGKDAATDR